MTKGRVMANVGGLALETWDPSNQCQLKPSLSFLSSRAKPRDLQFTFGEANAGLVATLDTLQIPSQKSVKQMLPALPAH
jgi:hypothetical protein